MIGDPKIWTVILFITVIGVISKLIYYFAGRKGLETVGERVPNLEPEKLDDVVQRYKKYGSKSLLLSSIPGIGAALAAISGAFGLQIATFIILVFISNFTRNLILFFVFDQTLSFAQSVGGS